ncbi:pentatricopeptide repeat-containing protein At3g13150 [Ziziphus jujuba]|uniref:Pentatricopeptide repeat-containing protein At3g13150 n=1 Tax=Ziziphus jujuba TaxID=326968 RepID=A0A6P6G2G1_ZIZJJ|nr:pentatricopeptide repeat-containing protein At3g13150 [Ziziphus jujuba]
MSSINRRLHGIFTNSLPAKTKTKTKTKVNTKTNLNFFPKSASTDENKLQKWVDNFKKSSDRDNFRNKRGIYDFAVRCLAAADQFSMIEEILEAQKKYGDITNEGFAMRLITLYGKSGMVDHAHKLFDELPQLQCERTVRSFNALLTAYFNAKKFDKVVQIFQELPSSVSVESDVISYNIFIHALCEMGSLDLAISTLESMENIGVQPNLISFNTLLNALYRNERCSEGERLWGLMEIKSIVPNVRSYNSRLRGMVNQNRILEAVELVGEMESKEIKPDVFTYAALIKGFCNEENLKEAKRWYGELQRNKCTPVLAIYAELVPLCCKVGDLNMAFELLSDAISCRQLIKEEMLKQVVDGLVKEKKIKEAKKLVELVKSSKHLNYKLQLSVVK